MLSYLESLKEAFSELHRNVLIACTLPVSTAECERNFSSIKLIKNELRSVMTGLWQMFNTPIVRFVPILFNSSHCSPYS